MFHLQLFDTEHLNYDIYKSISVPKYHYFPIIKTTDAELKAYSFLNDEVKDGILPIFELTRSRRSKYNPDADVNKRIDKLKEDVVNRPFILDLTVEQTLSNAQIDEMLNTPKEGFALWVAFIKELLEQELNVIPMINFHPDVIEDVEKEIDSLNSLSEYLAFRVSINEPDAIDYINQILAMFDMEKLILILDGEFIELDDKYDTGDKSDYFSVFLDQIDANFDATKLKALICAFSSFPSAVNDSNNIYGNYNYGSFPISEIITNNELLKEYKYVRYGDYGSVHPIRYEGFGRWVPRVDFMDNDKFYYYRYQRDDDGYITAANEVVLDSNYNIINEIDTWGDQEIAAADMGAPNGRSPSHWIAVRINLYITRQYLRLRGQSYISL